MIPDSYEAWKSCLVEKCKINPTKTFLSERIEILENRSHPETLKFIGFYGETHWQNICSWYRKLFSSLP